MSILMSQALLNEQAKSGNSVWNLNAEAKKYFLTELKEYLTSWDDKFLDQIFNEGAKTDKQKATVHIILEKAEARKAINSKILPLTPLEIKRLITNKASYSEWELSFLQNLATYNYTISSTKQKSVVDRLLEKGF